MSSCLGIYVQDNLIKYAKVSKERNATKVEAYGVKFYDNDIEKIIEQIIKETFSFQLPISINIGKEKYTYADIFNLLKAQDIEKSINTEFEFFCNNNNKNKNTIEFRRIKTHNAEDRDKLRVIYSYVDKANIVERLQLLDGYKTHTIAPVATAISNLNRIATQKNSVIINLEDNTEITTIVNEEIYKVDKIEEGMKSILASIAERENSVQKAYEICKNTTVYTKMGQNLKIEGNEYLDEIITALFEIIEKIKEVIKTNEVEIDNVYITGMGLIINNIDLLFQENFIDKKCEILVPGFIEKTNVKINIKDYIEVNSAISLALQNLNSREQDINFATKGNAFGKIQDVFTKKSKTQVKTSKPKITLKQIVNADVDAVDKFLLRTVVTLFLVIILYVGATYYLTNQISDKTAEVEKVLENSKEEIATITGYTTLINSKTSEYQKVIDNINATNSGITETYSSKNAIPNLLNKIMYNIPTGVQLLKIENRSGKNIAISAQAELYDQLGYFKAVLEEEGILTNVVTTQGTKSNGVITIEITGQLPY